jgi:sister-chromatid-cohesion protein PDS5
LILGKADTKLSITKKVYDIIYELNHICPSVLLAVLPQLEFKLKSTEESERMGSISLLARMFRNMLSHSYPFKLFLQFILLNGAQNLH